MPVPSKNQPQLPPVAWLLGSQLIASLKWILLYTAFGTKLDARDWMEAKVYPSEDDTEAIEKWKTMHSRLATEPAFWEKGEFWFDYLSDTGDGTKATYSIAYLCLSNLWTKTHWEESPTLQDSYLKLDQFADDQHPALLPRGEFLLIGGDTSYHLSDYATLHLRFQNPFNWAYDDLTADLKAVNKVIDDEDSRKHGTNRRPLFAIPGNHDYYDVLDGFRRQFRTPVRTRPENKVYGKNDLSGPQLMLNGFKREQTTSYIGLRLPFDWMIWGLDTEVGTIDERQRDFFRDANGGRTPDKLIVATSAPTTVFGKLADPDDEKCSKAFYQLKLARPFVKETQDSEPPLLPNQIRLDISGDVHQYARYWGPPNAGNTRKTAKNPAPCSPNYASVVSGLGGAFHHPSTTYVDEIKEQALYPGEEVSREAVAEEIFNPWKVFRGGGVGVIGGVIALILTFAAIANDSSRPAIHNFPPFVFLGITERERYKSTVVVSGPEEEQAANAPASQRGGNSPLPSTPSAGQGQAVPIPSPEFVSDKQPKSVEPFILWRGLVKTPWLPAIENTEMRSATGENRCEPNQLLYLWGECSVEWPVDYFFGMGMLIVTLGVIYLTFRWTEAAYELAKKQDEDKTEAREPEQKDEEATKKNAEKVARDLRWALWPTLLINSGLGIFGVLSVIPYRPFITPFGNSLLVFLTLVWAVASIIVALRYTDWLFIQASKTTIAGKDKLITWALALAALASLAVGLWLFGKNNLPAYLVADIIFVTVLLATLVGLIYVSITMGGKHEKRPRIKMFLIGFWHWLLQLGVALFLIKKGTLLTVALAALAYLLFTWIGKRSMKKNWKKRLVAAWLAFGATMLALPPFVYWLLAKWSERNPALRAPFWPHPNNPPSSFASYEWWGNFGGFWQLIPLTIACLFGLVLACIWVGWYFAVCLRYNGHNNEAGGAARIERYKQFIRFRLRPDELTGYVIAVDNPKTKGSDMKDGVRIVDVFHLKRPPAQALSDVAQQS